MSVQRFNLISLHEAVDLLGVSRSTFDRWRKLKQLPYVKIGKEILIDKEELEKWVRDHASSASHAVFAAGVASISAPQEQQVITIGYQSGTAHMWTSLLMKELGWLEEELALAHSGRTVRVEWFDAANGTVLLQGLIGGSVQIASLGDYPIVLSQSLRQTLPAFRPVLLAFDGKAPHGKGISLVIRKGLDIHDMSEICGWTLATVAQSSAGRRLSKLLQSLGSFEYHVVHKEMDESLSAIMKRQLAGSVMWEPYISLARHQRMGQIYFEEGMGEDYLTGVVAEENWVQHHQAETVAYLKAHLRVHGYMRKHPQAAAELVARVKRIPLNLAARIISEVRWDAAFYQKDMKALQLLHQENSDSNAIAMPSSFSHAISFKIHYLQEAVRALRLPPLGSELLEGEWADEQLY